MRGNTGNSHGVEGEGYAVGCMDIVAAIQLGMGEVWVEPCGHINIYGTA